MLHMVTQVLHSKKLSIVYVVPSHVAFQVESFGVWVLSLEVPVMPIHLHNSIPAEWMEEGKAKRVAAIDRKLVRPMREDQIFPTPDIWTFLLPATWVVTSLFLSFFLSSFTCFDRNNLSLVLFVRSLEFWC